jgi:hypothetical protein
MRNVLNTKKSSYFPLVLSLLLYFWIYYKSQIVALGLKDYYYYSYFYFSYLLIALSIIFIFLNNNLKKYFYIITISIIFTLYLFETYIYLKNNFIIFDQKQKKELLNAKTDKRDLYEVLLNEKNIGNDDVTIRISPSKSFLKNSLEFLPLSGISKKKTFVCNENGSYSHFITDRYGFNNPDFVHNENSETEYLLIGDSYVHGDCVNRPNDIASQLRLFSKKSVISLGYGGYGPLLQYATMREYHPEKTIKIIWVFSESNDLVQIREEKNFPMIKKYLENELFSQNLKKNQKKIDNFYEEIISEEIKKRKNFKFKNNDDHDYFWSFMQIVKLVSVRKILMVEEMPFEDFKNIFIKVKKFAQDNNSELYFIYLPDYYRLKNINYSNRNYKEIKKIITNLNINFIDLAKFFKNKPDPLSIYPFELVGHFNEKGYREIAKQIYKQTK